MAKQIKTLSVGDTIEVAVNSEYQTLFGQTLVFKIADKNHLEYPSNSVTVISEKIIHLMGIDAKETTNTNVDRQNGGNNRFIYSNLLQWLNSNATAGSWYSSKHATDAPPNSANMQQGYNPYETLGGFLNIFSIDFVSKILDTTTVVIKPVIDGNGPENFTAKIFIPSVTEMSFSNEIGIPEGSVLSLFSTGLSSNRVAYPSASAINNSNYTSAALSTTRGWHYALRTPVADTSEYFYYVSNSGNQSQYMAFQGQYGVRPLMNLSDTLSVSDTPNENGNYTVIESAQDHPTMPQITVPSSVTVGIAFNITWTQSVDPQNKAINYILEKSVNGGSFTEITSTSNQSYQEIPDVSDSTLQYRVKAKNSDMLESAYSTSALTPVSTQILSPPEISGVDDSLGTKIEGFVYEYTILSASSSPVVVSETLNGVLIRSYTATVGVTNIFNITGNTFTKATNGINTLKITATDGNNLSAFRTMTFTKSITSFSFYPEFPYETSLQPIKFFLELDGEIPTGSILKVEATNNAFDSTPIWEDCTSAVQNEQEYIFTNSINQNTQKGCNFRVAVYRNDEVGPCYSVKCVGYFK